MSHFVEPGHIPVPDGPDAADGPANMQAMATAIAAAMYFIGEIRAVASTTPPSALWLPCDGSPVSRTIYANLWNAIRGGHAGTSGDPAPYGNGDGSNTFNLPDLKGRSPVGAGAGAGLVARVPGGKFGVEANTLAIPNIPTHDHTGSTGQVAAHSHGGATVGPSIDLNHTHAPPPGGYLFIIAGATPTSIHIPPIQGGWTNSAIGWVNSQPVSSANGATGTADRSLQHVHAINADNSHLHTIAAQGGNPPTALDNTQPSLVIPFFIFAGVTS